MSQTYFKRYKMEIDLLEQRLPDVDLPFDYKLLPWSERLLSWHAQAKFHSFRDEMDANVFPCFGNYDGCLRLMRSIASRGLFLPETTWLAVWENPESGQTEPIGTIQGIDGGGGSGTIQNIGVAPAHRRHKVGTALIGASLGGFRELGFDRATLEVTAENRQAVRLYRRLGFRQIDTVYKSVEIVDP